MPKKYDLEDRLVDYAANIAKFVKGFGGDFTSDYYGKQLLRSAGSSALNFGESQGTDSVRDKVHKFRLVLKELKESRVNLKILAKIEIGEAVIRERLLLETEELIKIIATIKKNKSG